jgi:hypothetical protein
MTCNFDIAVDNALLAFVNPLSIAMPFIGIALQFILGSEGSAVKNEYSSAPFAVVTGQTGAMSSHVR